MSQLAVLAPPTPGDSSRGPRVIISWSEISKFRKCPHDHQLAYKERWTKPQPHNSALGKGTLFHKVIEVYYTSLKMGNSAATALQDARREIGDFRQLGIDRDVLDLIDWMVVGYHEYWGGDSEYEVVGVEHRFQLPLRTPAGRLSGFILKGGIDLLLRHRATSRLYIYDHKTCANLPKDRELELDDQFALYLWAMRQLGHNVFAAVHNAARTTRNKGDYPENVEEWHRVKAEGGKPGVQPKPQVLEARFARTLMDRTGAELDTIAQEALASARKAYSAANQHERTPDPDRCRWACSYTEACLVGRKLGPDRERRFLLDTGFVQDWTRH